FPEGTRSKDGKILPFKKGGLVLAISLDMPIIPIGIIGTRTLVKDKFSSISKNTVKLVLGEPIETKNLTYDDRNDLSINLRQEVVRLVES
ncbi:MAG: 1-acyl-sn-glycerol-3-phosphate acyltransferase, partial [Candidatus Neomarinimicrobiota bacterium]|nr:1-acyl-sn-glycerol-3-phosphate acyltransferase [Candidatus Neomarinimicrobiota bacterium]